MRDGRAGIEDVPDWLGQRAASLPDRPALITRDGSLTFAELDRQVAQTARRLAGLGMVEGSRVALLLRNGAPFVIMTHALARLGAVMVPLNTRLAAPEVTGQLAGSGATWLVHDDALAAAAEAAAAAVPGLVRLPLDEIARAREADGSLRSRIALGAVQGIIHTSATTGRAKGVMLSFGNHWWNAIASALNLGLDRNDRWLAPLPLYHVGGLAILWRSVIYGIPALVHEEFEPETVNRTIEAEGVTIVSVVSTMLTRMLDERGDRPYPPSLRCVLLGGGPAPAVLLERCLRSGVPVAPTYGLTEAASQVATLLPEVLPHRLGSVGKPLFSTEVKIEDGEILVRGPSVMLGYAGLPEETARALRGGWLHTGDMGYLDDEGYLYVTERTEDLIISGGENVYPAEVEAVLLNHPGIEDAGVVGLPDAEWGQIVAAALRLRPGVRMTDAEVRAFCRQHLAGYKVPRRIWFVTDLPRSASGKLIRRALRERVLATLAPPDSPEAGV
jgi:O-succinylbenzoic acid--CoA ligase